MTATRSKRRPDHGVGSMTISKETAPVEVPRRIVSRVLDRLPLTEFDSPAEYVTFVLEDVLNRVKEEAADDDVEPVDEEEVEDRLMSLRYLDE